MNEPPILRRWSEILETPVYHLTSGISPVTLANITVWTAAALVLGMIYTRPRTRPFAPIISNVRVDVAILKDMLKSAGLIPGPKFTVGTLQLLEEELDEKCREVSRVYKPDQRSIGLDSMSTDLGQLDEMLFLDEDDAQDEADEASSQGS